ncbi:MAG: nodulation protein NfeD [Phycisphaerales bacterium]
MPLPPLSRVLARFLLALASVAMVLSWAGADAAALLGGGERAAIAADGSGGSEGIKVIPAERTASRVVVIPIKGEIDGRDITHGSVMATSVRRRLMAAERAGADVVVFELDTPGGAVDGALQICEAIKSSRVPKIYAWVHSDAYSAGAIIALACDEIIVSDTASFGDAMPVLAGGPIGIMGISDPEILKKILPPLLAEVVDSVRRHNERVGAYEWDELLAQAIVLKDLSLWLVENVKTGQRMCIDWNEFQMLFPKEANETGGGGATRLVGTSGSTASGGASGGAGGAGGGGGGSKLRAMTAGDVNAQLQINSMRPTLTAADRGQWTLVEKVKDDSNAAMLKASDFAHYGFAYNEVDATTGRVKGVDSVEDLRDFFGSPTVRVLDQSWSEGLVWFLSFLPVRIVLILVFLVALFVEMTHPGATIPAIIAAVALVGLLGPSLLLGMANWWAIGAIVLGIGSLLVEIFVLPGFGIPGIAGVVLLFGGLVGVVTGSRTLFPQSAWERHEMAMGSLTVMVSTILAGAAIYFLAKHFGSIPVLNRFVLKAHTPDDDEHADVLRAMDADEGPVVRVGAIGKALTPMRPAGRVQIGAELVDAVSELGFIEAGQTVRVTSVTAFRIGVEAEPNA